VFSEDDHGFILSELGAGDWLVDKILVKHVSRVEAGGQHYDEASGTGSTYCELSLAASATRIESAA
jgi:hypothetical protein